MRVPVAVLILGVSLTAERPAQADAPPPDFAQCLAGLQAQAREQGRSPETVDELIPSLVQQPRVLELDRQQPEFMQTFGRYLSIRVTDSRIAAGREKLAANRALLEAIQRKYGVPAPVLVAFWGLETNYGGYLGTTPSLDALATLACDPRRSAFFTTEFLTALELLEREDLSPTTMQGSWAGAMGHTQFMPSTWNRYAVDGDGDGRVDLWVSEADALASGANFLAELGWVPGLRWGREVRLPTAFDYALAGDGVRRPLGTWADLGLRQANGAALPQAEVEAKLIVPAGADGPAFLVYRNFDVIMGWNRSESYALSVGLLADRIAGRPGLVQPPPNDEALRVEDVKRLQQALANRGFDPGPADGIWGPATRQALARFKASTGRVADGYPDSDTLATLLGPSTVQP
ncbi:MAG: lytic murein transglycosylase [Xanthomonadales bacterium]|jgi:membrane-bound lytic murein transglycosylase B|nr:lytic murein transglycosylase [Xanthomonadales bacterium]